MPTFNLLPKCPRCQRTFRPRIDLIGHLCVQCNNNPTDPSAASAAASIITPAPTPKTAAAATTTTTTTTTSANHTSDILMYRMASPTPTSIRPHTTPAAMTATPTTCEKSPRVSSPTTPTPAMWIRSQPVPIAMAAISHASD
ncbi:hypothetical protein SprV_0401475200 [Sparganum proliferum]